MLHMQRQTNTALWEEKIDRLTVQLTRVVTRDTKHPFRFWKMSKIHFNA